MPTLLCIETTTTNCSVALASDGEILLLKEDQSLQFGHGEYLHSYIEFLFQESELGWGALDGIAVSKGPGSYTGLRIGVSAAKGLCFACDIPLVAVPTLDSLARQVQQTRQCQDAETRIVSMLDARRMEVYTATYDMTYRSLQPTRAMVLSAASFLDDLDRGPVHFVGTGISKFQAICEHPNARFTEVLPSAVQMVAEGTQRFVASAFEDLASFEPFYLKDFVLKS